MATFPTWPVLGQPAAEPPSKNGTIWNERAMNRTPSAVGSDLKAKGLAVTLQNNRVVTDEVECLYQRLMRAGAMCGPDRSTGNPPPALPGRFTPQ
jgi:hypothetical protein